MAGKYVCNGAKIKCPLCSKQEGKLLVTSTQILLQDKPWATEADKQKINLQFQGNCTKFSNNPPPCIGVIVVGDWQNVAEGVTIDGHAPLLENSIIMCNTGSVPITIVNHVQKSVPTNLNQLAQTAAPVPTTEALLEPKAVEFYWMDERKQERIEVAHHGEKVHLYVKTINVVDGTEIKIKIKDQDNLDFSEGEKELVYSGTVNWDGVAELELIELIEDWKKTEKK
jgi:hypothetical protein